MKVPGRAVKLKSIVTLVILCLFLICPSRSEEVGHECRFLGIIGTAVPVETTDRMLKGLRLLGNAENPDGWGIGFFPPHTDHCLVKTPGAYRGADAAVSAPDYDYAREMAGVSPRALVAHVRNASSGCDDIADPHPFLKRKMIFAHNGDIDEDILLSLLTPSSLMSPGTSPGYETLRGPDRYVDSELYFILILQKIGGSGDLCGTTRDIRRAVWDLARALARAGRDVKLNMLLTDGQTLWAVRYASEKADYYTVYYCIPGAGAGWRAVCSAPLAGYDWTLLENRCMVRVRPGETPVFFDLTQNPYAAECKAPAAH
jgi:predicted glutamine amidotransferase